MSDFIGVVTTVGQTKIAAAIGGTALNLTTIRVGDGNGAPITPAPGMTDLVRRVGAAYPIIASGRDPVNATHWRVTAVIPVEDGPFDIREIGVFDSVGDMIAIARHVLVEKRSLAQGAAVELITDIVFPVSETAQVTVQIAPTGGVSIYQMLRAGFTVVESATVTAPPGAPALGRTHVVPAGATGAWAGLAGYLTQWNGTFWVAADVPVGFHVVDNSKGIDTGARWLERTAGGWKPGLSRLIQRQPGNRATVGGTANDLTITLDPAPASYAELLMTPIRLIPLANNTGAMTVTHPGLAARALVKDGSAALAANDVIAGRPIEIVDDGTQFHLLSTPVIPFTRRQVFLASGTFMPPPGCTLAFVRDWAGGGGSGGTFGAGSASSGGSGGEYREGIVPVVPGVGVAVTVGAGGAAGTSAAAYLPAGDGGTSSFGSLITAIGGRGGAGAVGVINDSTVTPPGLPGGGGDLAIPGNTSDAPFLISGSNIIMGAGGAAFGGMRAHQGQSGSGSTSGIAGLFPGGGATGSGNQANGAPGAPGLIIVDY